MHSDGQHSHVHDSSRLPQQSAFSKGEKKSLPVVPPYQDRITYSNLINVNHPFWSFVFSHATFKYKWHRWFPCFCRFWLQRYWHTTSELPYTTATNAFNNRPKIPVSECSEYLILKPKAHSLLEIIWFVLACQQRKWTAKQVPARRHSITSADVTRTLITPVLQRI